MALVAGNEHHYRWRPGLSVEVFIPSPWARLALVESREALAWHMGEVERSYEERLLCPLPHPLSYLTTPARA